MELVSLCPFPVASVAWQPQADEWNLTVCVKATFELVHGGEARIAATQEPAGGDAYFDKNPHGTLRSPSDFAPYKPRGDVLFVGSAHAPNGGASDALVVRVVVGEFSKALRVVGERAWTRGAGGVTAGPPTPFREIAVRYERGARRGDNLSGVSAGGGYGEVGRPLPNVEPMDDGEAATPGFGPLPPAWRARRAQLGEAAILWAYRMHARPPADAREVGASARPSLRGDVPGAPPPGFDFGFFNTAPRDQQVDFLRPALTIALENLHPRHPRFETRLPNVRPRVFRLAGGSRPTEVALRCDTVWIDGDRGIGVVSWRGMVSVPGPDAASVGRLAVACESPGEGVRMDEVIHALEDESTPSSLHDLRASAPPPLPAKPPPPPAPPAKPVQRADASRPAPPPPPPPIRSAPPPAGVDASARPGSPAAASAPPLPPPRPAGGGLGMGAPLGVRPLGGLGGGLGGGGLGGAKPPPLPPSARSEPPPSPPPPAPEAVAAPRPATMPPSANVRSPSRDADGDEDADTPSPSTPPPSALPFVAAKQSGAVLPFTAAPPGVGPMRPSELPSKKLDGLPFKPTADAQEGRFAALPFKPAGGRAEPRVVGNPDHALPFVHRAGAPRWEDETRPYAPDAIPAEAGGGVEDPSTTSQTDAGELEHTSVDPPMGLPKMPGMVVKPLGGLRLGGAPPSVAPSAGAASPAEPSNMLGRTALGDSLDDDDATVFDPHDVIGDGDRDARRSDPGGGAAAPRRAAPREEPEEPEQLGWRPDGLSSAAVASAMLTGAAPTPKKPELLGALYDKPADVPAPPPSDPARSKAAAAAPPRAEPRPAAQATQAAPPATPAASAAGPFDPATFTVEKAAAVNAEIALKRTPPPEVLRKHDVEEAAWPAIERHWLTAITKETERGKTTLLGQYDAAYVASLEKLRGPIATEEYARIVASVERGDVGAVLAQMGLPRAALMRIERVWTKRLAEDGALAGKVGAAVDAARKAEPSG